MRPELNFKVVNKLTDDESFLSCSLFFRNIDDFEPYAVAQQVPSLRDLLETRSHLSYLRDILSADERMGDIINDIIHDREGLEKLKSETGPENSAEKTESETFKQLFDQPNILELITNACDYKSGERHRVAVTCFMRELLQDNISVYRDPENSISSRIADLDRMISQQTSEIMHTPLFQRLEAAWRMLAYLVRNTETSESLKIKVLNVSKQDLQRDADRASEFDQSALFKKVYEEEFGVFGGEPYSLLIGDYEFGLQPKDIYLLEKLSTVAAASHSPFIAGAAPDLLGLDNFTQLNIPRDLARNFDTNDYARWRSFRQNEDTRYVALVLPRMLVRLPYGRSTVPTREFDFQEVSGTDHSLFLWGNAAFGLACRVAAAFAKYGWTAAIRGVEGGGVISNLPMYQFHTDDGNVEMKCPTEIAITDRRERELAALGLIPLVHCKGTDFACFFNVQSCQKPLLYENEFANAMARSAAQLPFVLAVSRFCQYLKAMMRDKTSSFASRAECEEYLNLWLSKYTTSDDAASFATKARFPLKSGRVEVKERRDAPGNYRAAAFLLPNFQLQGLNVPIRAVIELHQPRH